MKGVLYAWGDIRLKLGPQPDDPQLANIRRSGHLNVRGAMVAYGANPGNPDALPGSGLAGGQRGSITIEAGTIRLRQDSAYVSSTETRALPSAVEIVSWSLR